MLILQRTATPRNRCRRIVALGKVAGSSPVGHPARFRIDKGRYWGSRLGSSSRPDALVEGTRRVGYRLYRLQAEERPGKHQKRHRAWKYDSQNEPRQRAAPRESALFTCSDGVPPFPSFILPSALIHRSAWKGLLGSLRKGGIRVLFQKESSRHSGSVYNEGNSSQLRLAV
jgi:hypothetical protein